MKMDRLISENDKLQILDVRTPGEFSGSHIKGSVNIHWPDLRIRHNELRKQDPLAVMCGTGSRSGIACSILKRNGFSNILNVAGGYTGWVAAGLEKKN